MKLLDWKEAMKKRGVKLEQMWVTTRGDGLFVLHGFRAHGKDGSYLGLVIAQQVLDQHGNADGLIAYTETKGNDLDVDALTILEMGL